MQQEAVKEDCGPVCPSAMQVAEEETAEETAEEALERGRGQSISQLHSFSPSVQAPSPHWRMQTMVREAEGHWPEALGTKLYQGFRSAQHWRTSASENTSPSRAHWLAWEDAEEETADEERAAEETADEALLICWQSDGHRHLFSTPAHWPLPQSAVQMYDPSFGP